MFDPKLKEALGRVQKPGRYTGGEPGSVYKDKEKVDVRFAFCFPDTYEVGMSFLGEKILYELLNSHENWWCERAFMPWLDMKAEMERLGLPLYTMESKDPLTAFDAVGFTLQYELSYTNILAMLDLAGIPFYSRDRDERWPLIVAGGPCACNAEPIADFFDVVQLGEGENQLPSGHPGTHHQGHHQGPERVCPAHQLCSAHGGCHPGPCQHRGAARLRARLPVLSGRLPLPPHASARRQSAEQGRTGPVRQHRL